MKPFLMAAIALMTLTGTATAQNPTQDHRKWVAEQMVERLTGKFARMTSACKNPDLLDFRPKLSEACVNAVASANPILNTLRVIAASGADANEWDKIVGVARKYEDAADTYLNAQEQR